MPMTRPSAPMKIMSSGMNVFFIQKSCGASAGNTKSMPRPSASARRYMRPCACASGVAATSTATSACPPALVWITAAGSRARHARSARSAARARPRGCMTADRRLSGSRMATAIAFTLCLFVALGVFVRQLWERFNLLRAAAPVNRFDRIVERLQAVAVYFFGQKKFVRPEVVSVHEASAGWMHFFIFWGFTILSLQIMTMFGRGYSDRFYVLGFSMGLLGGPYLVLRDVMELIVLFWIAVAFVRWLVTRPPRLFGYPPAESRLRGHSHWEAYVILGFIATIMVTGLVYDGGRLVVHAADPDVAREGAWEPISRQVTRLLVAAGPGVAGGGGTPAPGGPQPLLPLLLQPLPRPQHLPLLTSPPPLFFLQLQPARPPP